MAEVSRSDLQEYDEFSLIHVLLCNCLCFQRAMVYNFMSVTFINIKWCILSKL